MSYPNDNPSYDMATIWQSGGYTPNAVVRNIRDNFTPINKNSMRNSVGAEISTVQNYVNSKYLGRPTIPVTSGFITTLMVNSGQAYDDETSLSVHGKANIHSNGGGIMIRGDNGNIDYIDAYGTQLKIGPNGAVLELYSDGAGQAKISAETNVAQFGDLYVGSTGSNDVQGGYLETSSSGRIGGLLTVGNNAFITTGGTQIRLSGAAGIDTINATGVQLIIYAGPTSSYANSGIAIYDNGSISTGSAGDCSFSVGRWFGCNGVNPTGMASVISNANSLAECGAAISGILNVIKNFGFMAKS